MLNLMIVLTTVPSGAFVSSIASEKSKPVAHLYTVSAKWKLTMENNSYYSESGFR